MRNLLLVCLILIGCAPQPNLPNTKTDVSLLNNGVFKVVDKQNGVTCYLYFQTAISCLITPTYLEIVPDEK